MDLEHYPNKEAVWGYDDITELIQERIDSMPDMPKNVAIYLSWSDEEDDSIVGSYQPSGAFYDELALKMLGKPFRLFFLALEPDSSLGFGEFLDLQTKTKFSECFLLRDGKALLRSMRLESIAEAEEKHRQNLRGMIEGPVEDPDQ